ncbi:MAG TPA: Ku protein [Bacilli bacterium]|jgi:DNA end-binding protein Ku|nr:Ku protein [Bacilli bacterium]HQC90261.1 Ku protein [Bacilli bacterium]
MAYSFKGAISFGLIYIPITLHNAVQSNQIGFNLIEKNTMSRVRYKKTCQDCDGREVKQKDIVKGYEYEEGKYVIFTNDDFEKIKSKRDKNIIIEAFVQLSEIDPVYYDRPYYVVPEKGAERAFALLKEAMEADGRAGIARSVLGAKETLVALRVKNGVMYLNTMHFHEEIRPAPYLSPEIELQEQELSLASALIAAMAKPFEPENYVDEYRQKIERAIAAKIQGKEIVVREEDDFNPALDLMTALQESLSRYETNARA